jgi:hypothetical protein
MHLVRTQPHQAKRFGFGDSSAPENRKVKELQRIILKSRNAEVWLSDRRREERRWLPKFAEDIFPSAEFLFARSAQ